MKKRDREVIDGRDRKRVGWKEKEGKRPPVGLLFCPVHVNKIYTYIPK
jgi:hypothetical protein